MGVEALEQWGDDVTRLEPLTGGGVNQVWSVRVNGQLAVARLGSRSDADLAWETDLLRHLDRQGLPVPVPLATTSGRLFADGLAVMTYVEGEPPETEADWRRVAGMLRQLHRLTQGWPQRPGWRSGRTDRLDESHVDAADFDLLLPCNAADLDDHAHDIAAQAFAAWDAARCWGLGHEFAVERLAEVRAV
jgi:Ser/Thr protein kinase RdoA (MazF antagonist)